MSSKKRVLMVCLGNTCRSTMAEAIFDDYITKVNLKNSWQVDSAGLKNYHAGKPPDERALMVLRRNNILNYTHKARVINPDDFLTFDWILCMDEWNLSALIDMKPSNSKSTIELLGNYDPQGDKIIDDPYCARDCTEFIKVFDKCSRSIQRFLELHTDKG